MADRKPYLGGCDALAARFNIPVACCSSCHEDDELEYAELGDYETGDGWYSCCCAMACAAKEADHD